MSANVDLSQLAVKRNVPQPARRPRHLVSRYLLPGGVLLGFVGVLAWAARDSFLPAKPVTVVPVLAVRGEVRQAGAPLFQAAGWVEPRPTPVLVPALTEGVVMRLLVVEGQEVKADEPVAILDDREAVLAKCAAEIEMKQHQAEAASLRASLESATINFRFPVQLQATAAEAENLLVQKENELAALPFLQRIAHARLDLARLDLANRKKVNSDLLPPIQLQQAQSEYDSAAATAEELDGRGERIKREIATLRDRRDAYRKRLELKADEARMMADVRAQVDAAEVHVGHARAAFDLATLRLERTTVRAPMTGRVLNLIARPGSRIMGNTPSGSMEAGAVVSLYDPARLQVRADVRLEDVARVRPGQTVRIETAAATGPIEGEVLFATSQADLQKNTLQVKLAVKSPPPALRPDMLVQVTFLADAPPSNATETDPLRLLVPRSLVETGESGSRVWVGDQATGTARLRTVRLGATAGDLVEVVEGLNPGDRLIANGREGLRDGERIRVTGEETAPASPGNHKAKH